MNKLFNSNISNREELFQQYRIFVESAEKISERRSHLNTFFIALHSLFVSGLSFFKTEIFSHIIPICIFGCILAFLWWYMLCNYRSLNKAKFKIIQEIEKHLPLNLYNTEWSIYKMKKHWYNPNRYFSFSRLEMVLPWLLIIVYAYIIVTTYYRYV